MSELSNNAGRLSDSESLSRGIVGSVGALSGAAIAVGVPLGILNWGNAQQYSGQFGHNISFAIMIAILLGSIVSLVSVRIAIKKR